MAGRPSKLTKQVEADLTMLLAQGVPVRIAAASVDVSPRSVRRWLHEGDLRERISVFELARVMGTSVLMIERHYGALLDGAGAGIASRLDAYEAAQEQADEADER